MKRKEKIEKFAPYLRVLADKMELRDWWVRLSPKRACDAALASACCTDGRKRITVYLGKNFFKQTREEQRLSLVHELTHAHFGSMHNPLMDTLHKKTHALYINAFEYGIDAVAILIAPSLPLPPKL